MSTFQLTQTKTPTGKCEAGYHVDLEGGGCKACLEGYHNTGGTGISCTCCPRGTTVMSGAGTGEDTCTPSMKFYNFLFTCFSLRLFTSNSEIQILTSGQMSTDVLF